MVVVVIRITNSCIEQAVIVVIIVVSVKYEQWHKNSENNEETLIETKRIFLLTLVAITEFIFKRF